MTSFYSHRLLRPQMVEVVNLRAKLPQIAKKLAPSKQPCEGRRAGLLLPPPPRPSLLSFLFSFLWKGLPSTLSLSSLVGAKPTLCISQWS